MTVRWPGAVLAVLAGLGPVAGEARPASRPAAERSTPDDPRQATEYRVRPGETLGSIAARVEVPRVLIIEANGLKSPYFVRVGQVLVIPRRKIHQVKPGETGFGIAYDQGVPWKAIALANGLDPSVPIQPGQRLTIPTLSKPGVVEAEARAAAATLALETEPAVRRAPRGPGDAPVRFAWPAPGAVRRDFIPRGRSGAHDGIDIAGEAGSAVRAAAPGTVVFAAEEPKSYGKLVIVEHGGGWFSAYGKLRRITVRTGQRVRAGERVGLLGNTGSTPQTELHFEIRRKTVPQDPLALLPARPAPKP